MSFPITISCFSGKSVSGEMQMKCSKYYFMEVRFSCCQMMFWLADEQRGCIIKRSHPYSHHHVTMLCLGFFIFSDNNNMLYHILIKLASWNYCSSNQSEHACTLPLFFFFFFPRQAGLKKLIRKEMSNVLNEATGRYCLVLPTFFLLT